MLEKTERKRRDRVDWYPWMVRYEAGESASALAAEAGCCRNTIYRNWAWFSALAPEERADLRRQAFRRLAARIESDALRCRIDEAGKQARGLEPVRRLLEAMEDEMKPNTTRPAAGGQHDEISPAAARAELLARLAEHARLRRTKALDGQSERSGAGADVPRLGALETKQGTDPA